MSELDDELMSVARGNPAHVELMRRGLERLASGELGTEAQRMAKRILSGDASVRRGLQSEALDAEMGQNMRDFLKERDELDHETQEVRIAAARDWMEDYNEQARHNQ